MVDHRCDDRGAVYMVVGTAGATHQVPFLPRAKWVQKQSMLFGVAEFTAVNSTLLRVEWLRDKNGTVGDSFEISRPTHAVRGAQ
jgi:hypothetical protein